jgi:hypothetical protein
MDQYEALALIVELEGRLGVLMAQLETLRRSMSRLRPGTPAYGAKLAQIDQLKADLHLVLVELEDTYRAYRQALAEARHPPSDEGEAVH